MDRRKSLQSLALGALAAGATAALSSRASADEGPSATGGVFSLADYPGTGDQRLSAALGACVAAGGGTVLFPAGDWRLALGHDCVLAANSELSIRFQGLGSSSRVFIECGNALDAFYFGNLKHVTFADLTFIGGTAGVDCSSVINLSNIRFGAVERCNFHGVSGAYDLVHANLAGLRVTDCGFFACGHRTAGSIGINENMRSVIIERCEFLDVHAPIAGATVTAKASDNLCWVRVLDFVSGILWGGVIRIDSCHFDEHARHAVLFAPENPATRHKHVEIIDCSRMASAHPAAGCLDLRQIDRLLIDGFSTTVTTSQSYIALSDINEARVRRCRVETDEGVTATLVADHLTTFV
jgi:hypothetical protein